VGRGSSGFGFFFSVEGANMKCIVFSLRTSLRPGKKRTRGKPLDFVPGAKLSGSRPE